MHLTIYHQGLLGWGQKKNIRAIKELACDLAICDKNFDKFNRVQNWYAKLVSFSCYKKNRHAINEEINDIVANFLYSFNEFLDQWKVFIERKYGKASDYFARYEQIRKFAFDNFDEYKITYGLRNFQHIGRAMHGYSTKQDGSFGIEIYASRDYLLNNNTFQKDIRDAISKQGERIDLMKIFAVSKHQLEQMHKKLVFYTITPELEKRAVNMLLWKQRIGFSDALVHFGYYKDKSGTPLQLEKIEDIVECIKENGGKVNFEYDEFPWRICNVLRHYAGTDYKNLP